MKPVTGIANRFYAGVGSRETPDHVLELMKKLAGRLAARGYVLRSGAAPGADTAFEEGCIAVRGIKEIWLPWPGFNDHPDTKLYPSETHYEMAEMVHPAWERLTRGPRSLHARNVGQVLGEDIATPVSFVLCWTRDGCESEAQRTRDTGGTATAIVLADRWGIPVFNLAKPDGYDRFVAHVLAEDREFHPDNTLPCNGEVFVFGSNLAGRHGKGAAAVAKEQFGAQAGVGAGLQGQSFGIPTKDGRPLTGNERPSFNDPEQTLSLESIRQYVDKFIAYAKAHEAERFFVTRVGCGLAGYQDEQVAPLFVKAPSNCSFPEPWQPWLGPRKRTVPLTGADVSFSETRVVHVREEPYDVYIGRQMGDGSAFKQSEFANPFRIGEDGTREEVVQKFADYAQSNEALLGKVHLLKGKRLGCWCKTKENPHALCHGDVLAALADGRAWSLPPAVQPSLF